MTDQDVLEKIKQAVAFQKVGKLEDAIQVLRGILQVLPDKPLPIARYNLAKVLEQKTDARYIDERIKLLTAVLVCLSKGIQLNKALKSCKVGALHALYVIYKDKGEMSKAETVGNGVILAVDEIWSLLNLHLQSGHTDAVFKCYQHIIGAQGLTIQPKQQYFQVLVQLIQQKLSLQPASPATWQHLLGCIYFSSSQAKQAECYFSLAVENEPENPKYLIQLGAAQGAVGDLDAAKSTFEKAKALSPDDEILQQNIKNLERLKAQRDSSEMQEISAPQVGVKPVEEGAQKGGDTSQPKQTQPEEKDQGGQDVSSSQISEPTESREKKADELKTPNSTSKDTLSIQKPPSKLDEKTEETKESPSASSSKDAIKQPALMEKSTDFEESQGPSFFAKICPALMFFGAAAAVTVGAVAFGLELEDKYNGACIGSGCDTFGL